MKTSFLHIEANPSDKAKWVKQAQRDGLKLTDWVSRTLNSACPADDQLPAWLAGLSNRSAAILHKAGFESRYQAQQADNRADWEWTALPNCGPGCAREIREWLNHEAEQTHT